MTETTTVKSVVRLAMVVGLLAVASCGTTNCLKPLKGVHSPNGRVRADVVERADCVSSLNTIVLDVELATVGSWLRNARTVFTIKGSARLEPIWIDNNNLVIRYYIPGETAERILRKDETWRVVRIKYEPRPWSKVD